MDQRYDGIQAEGERWEILIVLYSIVQLRNSVPFPVLDKKSSIHSDVVCGARATLR